MTLEGPLVLSAGPFSCGRSCSPRGPPDAPTHTATCTHTNCTGTHHTQHTHHTHTRTHPADTPLPHICTHPLHSFQHSHTYFGTALLEVLTRGGWAVSVGWAPGRRGVRGGPAEGRSRALQGGAAGASAAQLCSHGPRGPCWTPSPGQPCLPIEGRGLCPLPRSPNHRLTTQCGMRPYRPTCHTSPETLGPWRDSSGPHPAPRAASGGGRALGGGPLLNLGGQGRAALPGARASRARCPRQALVGARARPLPRQHLQEGSRHSSCEPQGLPSTPRRR